MINKKLMVYGFHKEEEQNLLLIGYKSKSKLIRVNEGMVKLPLLDILEGKELESKEVGCDECSLNNNEKFIVFHNFSQRELNETISLIRKHRDLRCILAVTTAANLNWTFEQLMSHLVEEREQLRGNR